MGLIHTGGSGLFADIPHTFRNITITFQPPNPLSGGTLIFSGNSLLSYGHFSVSCRLPPYHSNSTRHRKPHALHRTAVCDQSMGNDNPFLNVLRMCLILLLAVQIPCLCVGCGAISYRRNFSRTEAFSYEIPNQSFACVSHRIQQVALINLTVSNFVFEFFLCLSAILMQNYIRMAVGSTAYDK